MGPSEGANTPTLGPVAPGSYSSSRRSGRTDDQVAGDPETDAPPRNKRVVPPRSAENRPTGVSTSSGPSARTAAAPTLHEGDGSTHRTSISAVAPKRRHSYGWPGSGSPRVVGAPGEPRAVAVPGPGQHPLARLELKIWWAWPRATGRWPRRVTASPHWRVCGPLLVGRDLRDYLPPGPTRGAPERSPSQRPALVPDDRVGPCDASEPTGRSGPTPDTPGLGHARPPRAPDPTTPTLGRRRVHAHVAQPAPRTGPRNTPPRATSFECVGALDQEPAFEHEDAVGGLRSGHPVRHP